MPELRRAARAAFFIAIALALPWHAIPVYAGTAASLPPNCGEHQEIAGVLKDRYGEHLAASGQSAGGGIELWIGSARSWSLLRILPGGIACLIAAGENVEFGASSPPARAPSRVKESSI